jgi:hypothetical protein
MVKYQRLASLPVMGGERGKAWNECGYGGVIHRKPLIIN